MCSSSRARSGDSSLCEEATSKADAPEPAACNTGDSNTLRKSWPVLLLANRLCVQRADIGRPIAVGHHPVVVVIAVVVMVALFVPREGEWQRGRKIPWCSKAA